MPWTPHSETARLRMSPALIRRILAYRDAIPLETRWSTRPDFDATVRRLLTAGLDAIDDRRLAPAQGESMSQQQSREVVSVRMSPELRDRIAAYARPRDLDMSSAIRLLTVEGLNILEQPAGARADDDARTE